MDILKNERVMLAISFVGIILSTVAVIAAGYIHGKMSVGAVWNNLHNFH